MTPYNKVYVLKVLVIMHYNLSGTAHYNIVYKALNGLAPSYILSSPLGPSGQQTGGH